MSSPGLTVTVAVAPVPLMLAEPQSTLVSVQPAVAPSVTDLEPSPAAEGEHLLVRVGRVSRVGVEREAGNDAGAGAVNGKESEPEFTGSVTFMIVSFASFLFV